MNDLRTAAQRALERLRQYHYGNGFAEDAKCIADLEAALALEAEPLNLSDRAVQRRLAAQWGYVPQQAEPVEPVSGVVLNEEGRAALVEHGREEWHCVSRNARRLYTAPPQRKLVPLTEEEIMHIGMTHQSLRQVVRAVERAHGIT